MIEAYAVPDVRASEARAIAALDAAGHDGGAILMRRAADALAEIAAHRLEERGGRRVVALVGGGNNGGDALFALARLARYGYSCVAITLADPVHDGGLRAVRRRHAAVLPWGGTKAAKAVHRADLVIDGITGIGGRPGLGEEAAGCVAAIPASAYVLAVDLPSGADPAGRVASEATVFADETVTFGTAKPVHLLPATRATVGRFTVVDIGLDLGLPSCDARPAVASVTVRDIRRHWPVPGPGDDKYSRGVVGVVAGSLEYPGAAVLATLGALCSGPGMVRYLGPQEVRWLVHQAAPEAVCVPGRVQAWVVGCGLDPAAESASTAEQWALVDEALASELPVVVDAGALERVARRHAPTLLTPHAGELARLVTRLSGSAVERAELVADPVGAARLVADRLDAWVLVKGSTTLVVPPSASGEPVMAQSDAPAWLATAGAGDVLAGILGTLLAAGLPIGLAAAMGAWVHGRAADDASAAGPLRVTEVAASVPTVVAAALSGPGR